MTVTAFKVDLVVRTMTVSQEDGSSFDVSVPDGFLNFETNIRSIAVCPVAGQMIVGLPGDTDARVELLCLAPCLEVLRASRPAVYLDQNHWSRLAAWRHGHRVISEAEGQAAESLVELVKSGQVVLPVSAGHLVETSPLYAERRVALASTVLELSHGWQMRNPVDVRREELTRGLCGEMPSAAMVFSPNAGSFFSLPRSEPATAGLPSE